jgi:hypothetical protein
MLKHRSNVQGNEENSNRKRQYRNSQASIVGVGNGDEFPDFADLFFNGIKNVRVCRSIGNTFFFGLMYKNNCQDACH